MLFYISQEGASKGSCNTELHLLVLLILEKLLKKKAIKLKKFHIAAL